jgi:hypothetical protein
MYLGSFIVEELDIEVEGMISSSMETWQVAFIEGVTKGRVIHVVMKKLILIFNYMGSVSGAFSHMTMSFLPNTF